MSYGYDNMFDINNCVPNGVSFFGFDHQGKKQFVCLDNFKSIQNAYLKYSPLAAVILRMADMFANGKFEVLNRTTQNYTRGAYKEWDKLLAQPNFLQTGIEFRKQLYTYMALFGWCYAMPIYPASITDRPMAIFLIPPYLLDIEPITNLPHRIKKGTKFRKIYLRWNGLREELDESKLILFKDSAATIVNSETLLPESRIKYLKLPISNGIGAMESRNSLILDRGASGILANVGEDAMGTMPLLTEEKERLEKLYKRSYGLTPDKESSIIITNASLKWQSMTLNVKDLMLHEEHKSCIMDICDMLGYNHRLLSHGDGINYDNVEQDKQAVYQDSIIPQANCFIEQLNAGLKTIENNIELVMCYDHVPVLQQSEKDRGEGRLAMNRALELEFKNGLITRNMWLEKLGEDTQSDPVFNLYIWQMTPEQRGLFIQPNNKDDDEKGTGKED